MKSEDKIRPYNQSDCRKEKTWSEGRAMVDTSTRAKGIGKEW